MVDGYHYCSIHWVQNGRCMVFWLFEVVVAASLLVVVLVPHLAGSSPMCSPEASQLLLMHLPMAATSPNAPKTTDSSIRHQPKQHTLLFSTHLKPRYTAGLFSCSQPPVINITATLDPHQHLNTPSLRSLGHRRNTTHSPPTHTQTNDHSKFRIRQRH